MAKEILKVYVKVFFHFALFLLLIFGILYVAYNIRINSNDEALDDKEINIQIPQNSTVKINIIKSKSIFN